MDEFRSNRMAGRPRKQAKTVLDFENRILDLDIDLFIAMPKMYRDQSGPDTSSNDEIRPWLRKYMP